MKKPLLLESIDTRLEDGALVQFTYKYKESTGAKAKFIKKFLAVMGNS
jgi:hypothetical protein